MNEIHVIFPESGPPIASQNQQAVINNQQIAWYVQSANDKVKQVKIQFEKEDALFFEAFDLETGSMGFRNWYQKKLDYMDVDKNDAKMKERVRFLGNTLIYGKAPEFGKTVRRRDDKYTIIGLDANGEPIKDLELDPIIVTDTP